MAQFAANRVYQDFEPFFEWNEDKASVTLTIMLPGFRRDQLKVQVTSTPLLRINGEREVTQNVLRRFSKEFSIPSYCDTNNVSAKFERGMLQVKFPKIETPLPPPPPPPTTNNDKPQEQEQTKNEEQKVAAPVPQQEASSQEGKNNYNNSDQQKEKEEAAIGDEKDQEKKSKEAMESNAEKEKGKEPVSSEVVGDVDKKVSKENVVKERKGSRIAQRLKTRMLDFTLSVGDEKDEVGQGYGRNLITGIKRPKMFFNIVVAILLVMVLGIYVKHAFWSSSQGGSEKFHEF